jgi:hypothetical protein
VSQPNQTGDRLKVALCTREYPREVYGGAGVHVEYPAEELSEHVDLTVHRIERSGIRNDVGHFESELPRAQAFRFPCHVWH